jgi:hypothetical protein
LIDKEFDRYVVPTPELRYLPNKLHGDELVDPDGRVYGEDNDEWLDADEIEILLVENPAIPLAMVDRSRPAPVVYGFRSPDRAWESVIRPRYISGDGFPPTGFDVYFVAHLWADPDGEKLLLFELECWV